MAYRSLSSLVPNVADLLALDVEELAGVLLAHLNSYESVAGNSIYQHGGISRHNFFVSSIPTSSLPGTRPEYGDKQREVNEALMEAWAWLQSEGFLVEQATSAGWFDFHVLRRTSSSLMNDLGVEGKVASDQLGHTLDVNQNVYTQTSLKRRQEAVDTLETALKASLGLLALNGAFWSRPLRGTS